MRNRTYWMAIHVVIVIDTVCGQARLATSNLCMIMIWFKLSVTFEHLIMIKSLIHYVHWIPWPQKPSFRVHDHCSVMKNDHLMWIWTEFIGICAYFGSHLGNGGHLEKILINWCIQWVCWPKKHRFRHKGHMLSWKILNLWAFGLNLPYFGYILAAILEMGAILKKYCSADMSNGYFYLKIWF